MKARLLEGWNGHSAGEVIENAVPGTAHGQVPRKSAEWFDDDDDVKPVSAKTAQRTAKDIEDKGKK